MDLQKAGESILPLIEPLKECTLGVNNKSTEYISSSEIDSQNVLKEQQSDNVKQSGKLIMLNL